MGGAWEAAFCADGVQAHRDASAVDQRNRFRVGTRHQAHQSTINRRHPNHSFLIFISWPLNIPSCGRFKLGSETRMLEFLRGVFAKSAQFRNYVWKISYVMIFSILHSAWLAWAG